MTLYISLEKVNLDKRNLIYAFPYYSNYTPTFLDFFSHDHHVTENAIAIFANAEKWVKSENTCLCERAKSQNLGQDLRLAFIQGFPL